MKAPAHGRPDAQTPRRGHAMNRMRHGLEDGRGVSVPFDRNGHSNRGIAPFFILCFLSSGTLGQGVLMTRHGRDNHDPPPSGLAMTPRADPYLPGAQHSEIPTPA